MARQADVQYVRFFTEGSAAPQVAPQIREDPYYVPRVRRRKKKLVYVDPVAVFGILVSLALAVSMLIGVHHLQRAQMETQQMEQYVSGLEQENIKLTDEYHHGYNLQAVEKTAKAMGMVPADELPKVPVKMEKPEQQAAVQEESLWQKISTFLTGLFA